MFSSSGSLTDFEPLALTTISWETFQQKFKGKSPTRGHDDIGIKLDDPVAFVAALSFDNDPINNLRYKQAGFDHVFASFIGTASDSDVIDLLANSRIKALRNENIIILTASIQDWLDSIIACSDLRTSFGCRAIITDIYHLLCRTRFKEIFYTYTIVEHTDKTILIKWKR